MPDWKAMAIFGGSLLLIGTAFLIMPVITANGIKIAARIGAGIIVLMIAVTVLIAQYWR